MKTVRKRLRLFSPFHIYVATLTLTPLVGAFFTWYNLRARYGRRRPKTYIMLWGMGLTAVAAGLTYLAMELDSGIGMLVVVLVYGLCAARLAQGPLRRPYDEYSAREKVYFPRLVATFVLGVPILLFLYAIYSLLTAPVHYLMACR